MVHREVWRVLCGGGGGELQRGSQSGLQHNVNNAPQSGLESGLLGFCIVTHKVVCRRTFVEKFAEWFTNRFIALKVTARMT